MKTTTRNVLVFLYALAFLCSYSCLAFDTFSYLKSLQHEAVKDYADDNLQQEFATEIKNLVINGDEDIVFRFDCWKLKLGMTSLTTSLHMLLPSRQERKDFLEAHAQFISLNTKQPVKVADFAAPTTEMLLKDLATTTRGEIERRVKTLGYAISTLRAYRNAEELYPPENAKTWHIDLSDDEPHYAAFVYDSRLCTEFVLHPIPMMIIDSEGAQMLFDIVRKDLTLFTIKYWEGANSVETYQSFIKLINDPSKGLELIETFSFSHADHVFEHIYPRLNLAVAHFPANTLMTFPKDLVHRSPQICRLPNVNHHRLLLFLEQKK